MERCKIVQKGNNSFDFQQHGNEILIRGLRGEEGICWWKLDYKLELLHKYAPTMCFEFRSDTLPKRCVYGYNYLCETYLLYLRTCKSRIHVDKVKNIIKLMVKNISKVKWCKSTALRYVGDNKQWSNVKVNPDKLSYSIFKEFIDWLSVKGYVTKYKGSGGCGYINTTNMLVCSNEFINLCTNKINPNEIEKELQFRNKDNIIIHQEIKGVKYPREILPEEEKQVNDLDKVLIAYNESLENRTISVCGHEVKEAFFRRIFNENLDKGGRYYDHGQLLSRSKEDRATTLIDGEATVSLDYKHLHPSICYELKGVPLGDKDPYGIVPIFYLDKDEMKQWRQQYNIKRHPNVGRNLAKVALLCMINAKDKKSCMAAISQEINSDHRKVDGSKRKFVGVFNVEVKNLVDALYQHNIDIKEYFYSGHGVVMQNLDSKMIDYCIRVLLEDDEILIPVHDCVIVRKGISDHSHDTMLDAYEHVLGSRMNCKVEVEGV